MPCRSKWPTAALPSLQLGLTVGDDLFGISQIDLLLTEIAQDALALSQHSRNLLLVERKISEDTFDPPTRTYPPDCQP